MGKDIKIYTLTTFWLDDEPREPYGYYHKNVCQQGFWLSQGEAEDFLLKNWGFLHEFWNNAAVIEEYDMGYTGLQYNPKKWWYHTDDCRNKDPILLEDTPERMKYKNIIITLGR